MSPSEHHSFDINLAKAYGIEEAIIIHHFQHWIGVNSRKKDRKRNFKEGRYWTYQTISDIAAHFPYLNERKVKYAIERLLKLGILRTGNFNKKRFDKTVWYSLNIKEISTKDKIVHGGDKIVSPIPDTKTHKEVLDSKKEKITTPVSDGFKKKKSRSTREEVQNTSEEALCEDKCYRGSLDDSKKLALFRRLCDFKLDKRKLWKRDLLFWLKEYSADDVEVAVRMFNDVVYEMKKEPTFPEAYISKILKDNATPPENDFERNRLDAVMMKRQYLGTRAVISVRKDHVFFDELGKDFDFNSERGMFILNMKQVEAII